MKYKLRINSKDALNGTYVTKDGNDWTTINKQDAEAWARNCNMFSPSYAYEVIEEGEDS